MNKYITPLTENEVPAWQKDCYNSKTHQNVTWLLYGLGRLLGTPSSLLMETYS